MAGKKQETGLLNVLKDWWGSETKPAPSRIPPVDPRTGNRSKPSPEFNLFSGETLPNIYSGLQRSHYGADFIRDLAKGAGSVIANPKKAYESLGGIGNAAQQIFDARQFEQTGKWPESSFSKMMPPAQLNAWRKQATQRYRALAASYSYIDPKTNERTIDWDGIQRGMTNDPVGTLAPLFGGAAGKFGKAAGALGEVSDAARLAGDVSKARKAGILSRGLRRAQIVGDVAARGLNPAGSAASLATQSAVRGVKALQGVKVLDEAGNFTPEVEAAIRQQGYDPAIYASPEAKVHFQDALKKGITPAAIRRAVGAAEGVPVTRSMAMREMPPREFGPDVANTRQEGAQNINQQMEVHFGHTPEERDLGSAFAQSYANAKNGVDSAYQRAFSHQGVFQNAGDFTAGVRQAVDDELSKLGTSLDRVMSNPRFPQAHNAISGAKIGGRNFGGVFQKLDELAGSAPSKPLQAADLSGEIHTFDPASKTWVDASGRPVTAPAKTQYLDAVSDRANLKAPTPSQNNLTPQNLDEDVRKNVNYFFREAKSPEERNVLSAINRGLDNYVEANAANFTGDGRALSRDLQNARSSNQQFIQNFDQSPNKAIREASGAVSSNLTRDENGLYKFTGDPKGLTAHFESKMIDPNTLEFRRNYGGRHTIMGDAVFRDLYNVLEPEGQGALIAHVRNAVATSPADPSRVSAFVNNSPFFSPAEQETAQRLQNARAIALERPTEPSTFGQGTGTRWGMRFSAPLIGQKVGEFIGGMFGSPGIGGTVGMMAGSAAEGKAEGLTQKRRWNSELTGLPPAPVSTPHLFMPITTAGAVAAPSGQSPFQQQPQPQPEPKPAAAPAPVQVQQGPRDPYALPPSLVMPSAPVPQRQRQERDPYALPPGFDDNQKDIYALPKELEAQPQYRGGRTAYKSGGKVQGRDIEPLVRSLMNKAKKAKKISNKITEPLLNEHDDAVASALAVAQKAI